MTYAWLVSGLGSDARAKVDAIIRGPEPEDPQKEMAENREAFGKLFAMQAKGLR